MLHYTASTLALCKEKQDAVKAYIWAALYYAYVSMKDKWVVQWYCIFGGLVEMSEVVGVELYSKLIAKIMGVVCEVVAGFLHGVVFIGCW